jgi:hypothetical protein
LKKINKTGKDYWDYIMDPQEIMTRGLEFQFYDHFFPNGELKNQLNDYFTPESI